LSFHDFFVFFPFFFIFSYWQSGRYAKVDDHLR
jgi:hypothetical protein